MNNQTLDALPDLEIHLLQPQITEEMINAHWSKILPQLFQADSSASENDLPVEPGNRRLK